MQDAGAPRGVRDRSDIRIRDARVARGHHNIRRSVRPRPAGGPPSLLPLPRPRGDAPNLLLFFGSFYFCLACFLVLVCVWSWIFVYTWCSPFLPGDPPALSLFLVLLVTLLTLSSKLGASETVRTRFWPWCAGESL